MVELTKGYTLKSWVRKGPLKGGCEGRLRRETSRWDRGQLTLQLLRRGFEIMGLRLS